MFSREAHLDTILFGEVGEFGQGFKIVRSHDIKFLPGESRAPTHEVEDSVCLAQTHSSYKND